MTSETNPDVRKTRPLEFLRLTPDEQKRWRSTDDYLTVPLVKLSLPDCRRNPGENTMTEKLGRFDHHPDPAIDFCVEVETLENEWLNTKIGFMNGTPPLDALRRRVDKAMDFRVGGDLNAIAAKSLLRRIDGEMGARGAAHV